MSTTANETMSVSSTGFFCDLCKLDFTTKEELKEHCWSILHHGKLNKSKGRDCVHECSLCNETFVELLSFTKHLHGDAHQDRYNTWKKEQVNHWQSRNYSPRNYSPINTTSTTSQKDFLTNSNGNRVSGHNDKECQGSFWERPHWQNSRYRNRNRKTRHNDQEAVPVRLHTFRIENSGTITELGHGNEHSEVNFNFEQESSFSDFKGTRKGHPSRNDFSQAAERPNTRNWAQSNKARGDALGKSHRGRHKSYYKSHKQRKSSAKRQNNSRGSSTSFDKSVSSLDGGLSSSMDRPSSTTGLGVPTRTCSSEFMNSQTGKDIKSSEPFEPKTVQNSPGNEENRTRSLRNRSKYTWMSDSYRATLNNDGLFSNNQLYTDFTTTSSKPNEKKLKSDGSGSSHSIVGNGADDTEVFTLTEETGHDNGNPGDSKAEIVSNNSNSDQSKLETRERVPFVSKRRTRSSYAKGNAKDFDMTMDNETGSKTGHFLSHNSKHSTKNESKSTNAKLTKEPKINTRLRSRSSSDDSTLLSRQNTVRSSTHLVTQYQSLPRPGGLGSLEFTSSNLGLKETKSKESPSQNGDKDSHKLLAKIKTESSDSALKNVDSGTVSKIIEEQQNSGGEAESNTECNFVHIDGVQCPAKASERYCSYHKKFPQGNLIKSEPQDNNPTSSLSSLDLSSTTVHPDTSMSFNSGYPRLKDGYERNSSPEKNVEMMDLSMSTNFLSVAHSHMRKPSYTNWSETRSLRDEREKTVPVSWARTSSAIILPASSRSENKEPFSAHVANTTSKWQMNDHRDEPMGNKIERVSPAKTPPSPSVHSPAREVGASVATLDLSRLNLPPNVRRALAMKYSAKKPSECVTTVSNVVPNLTASRNRFVEAKKEPRALLDRLEQPNTLSYQPLPPPGTLRAAPIRQQRSISLDSYPSKVGPASYERPGLVPSTELFPTSVYSPTHSPLPKPVNVFSFAINSKQSTLSGKPKMIDLNNAAYLPPRSSPLAKFSSSNQAKESNATQLEKHGMTELNHTSINKEAVMSKLTIPALRSKMRIMSSERDSAYFKGDSAIYHSNIVHPTLPMSERRPSSAEQDRYIVLGSGAVTSSSNTGMYPQEGIERPVLLPVKSRVLFDSREGNGYRESEAKVRKHVTEQNERDATAIALESHFRQSLNPRECASKLNEHGLVDLGSVDSQQKTVSTRNLQPVATHITGPGHLRKPESTQLPITNINDAVTKNDDHALKRKATELHEPQLKKRKGLENSTIKEPMSYLPGFEVQELLRLEHQEQSQLRSLHDIQDQIKATKLKLQALSIELENLQSKESKISKEISHTKNKRLDILQGALHRNNRTSEEASLPSTISSVFTSAKSSEMPSTTSVQSVHRAIPHCGSTDEAPPSATNAHAKDMESTSPQSNLELSKTLTDSNNHIEDLSQTTVPIQVKTEVVETAETLSSCPNGDMKATPIELSETHTQETQDMEMAGDAVPRDDEPTRDEQPKCTEEKQVDEHFEKSKKDFLNKIRQELNTPKKRHQMKKHRKKFSEAKISSTIAVSRDKLLLVREKMLGWKVQQDGIDSNTPSTDSDDRPLDQNENTPSLSYEETNLPSSEVPMRDCITKPEKASSKSRAVSRSGESGSKADSKTKAKVRVVIKKGHSSEVKVNLKKKRKSSHPNSADDRPTSPEITPPEAENNNSEQGKDESEKPMNVDTEQVKTQGSQFHVAAVESLRKKLEKTNSVKSLSTSKARASSFEGHTGAVCALKVHQGRLYSSSADKTTKAFDIQNGECVKEYLGHNHAVNCLEISQDGDRLFTGSNDQTVRSYNIKTGSCTHKFTFDGRVMCLHIGFGFLYVGLSTGTVTIVDLMTNTCVERLQCHEPRAVSCLATASEGQRSLLCTGSFDATISIRDHKDGLLIKTLKSHTMTVLCMQVVENVIYSGAADCKVLAHNLNTGELLRSYCGQTLSVSGLQVIGRVLVSSCLDKLIRCYDLMSAELLQAYGGQSDMIFSVHVSNGRIYSGGRDGKLTSVKLDLRVYHPCKWKDCQLNFGISSHMKDHLKESHVIQPGTIEKCLWADCGQVFADSEGIETIMDHVLGHVDSKGSNSKN